MPWAGWTRKRSRVGSGTGDRPGVLVRLARRLEPIGERPQRPQRRDVPPGRQGRHGQHRAHIGPAPGDVPRPRPPSRAYGASPARAAACFGPIDPRSGRAAGSLRAAPRPIPGMAPRSRSFLARHAGLAWTAAARSDSALASRSASQAGCVSGTDRNVGSEQEPGRFRSIVRISRSCRRRVSRPSMARTSRSGRSRGSGRTAWAKWSGDAASIRSVLDSLPVASAKRRAWRGLTTATAILAATMAAGGLQDGQGHAHPPEAADGVGHPGRVVDDAEGRPGTAGTIDVVLGHVDADEDFRGASIRGSARVSRRASGDPRPCNAAWRPGECPRSLRMGGAPTMLSHGLDSRRAGGSSACRPGLQRYGAWPASGDRPGVDPAGDEEPADPPWWRGSRLGSDRLPRSGAQRGRG